MNLHKQKENTMKMKDLLDKQKRIHNELKNIVDAPAGENGDLSAEQETRAANLQQEMARTKNLIDIQADLDETERRMSGTPVNGDPKLDKECRSFSMLKAIQHQLGARVDAGRELEISQELARMEQRSTDGILAPYSVFERRATITTTTPAGGPGSNMIGTDHLGGQFIDLLRESNPLSALGVRILSGLQGNVEIPKLKTSTAVGWVAENTAFADTDAAFDKITMTPKHVGALTSYSRNMLLQSSPDIESILRSDLAQVLGMEVARATINGTGANAQPLGILNQTGIQEVTTPAIEMEYVPTLANALFMANVPNVAFLANNGFKLAVDNLLTADGLPIGAATFFRGYPFKFTSLVPAANVMIAGDFSDVIQGMWSAVEILVNPYMESAYTKGNIALRIILTMDVAIRHPESFATLVEAA
jgi:HK97 family phage major capsid protein